MKSLACLSLLVGIFIFPGCSNRELPEKIASAVDSVNRAYVPVYSESLCDLSASLAPDGSIVLKGRTNIAKAVESLKTVITSKGYEVTDSTTVLPVSAVAEKPWGLITLSVCNMRGGPSHADEMVTQTIMGTPVKILDRRGGWLYIQAPDSYLGWTNDDAVAEKSEEEMNNWKNASRVIYTANSGIISDSDGNTVSDIVKGSVLEMTGENHGSYMVILADGRQGFVKKSEATDFRKWAEASYPDPKSMISFAKSLLGSPYLWGGTSTKGIDCSGFVKIIYFSQGMILSRDASAQFLYGREVPMVGVADSLVPGDLVFFGRVRDGKKRIGHTGMYIGDTEVIHSSGMVKINSLDSTRTNYSDYLGSTFQGAKRFIGSTEGKGYERVINNKWYF